MNTVKEPSSLIYRILFTNETASEEKDHLLFDIIELFVEKNNLLCGGGDYIEIYNPNETMIVSMIKEKFLLFLKKYSHLMESISFYSYNEEREAFIHYETVHYNDH